MTLCLSRVHSRQDESAAPAEAAPAAAPAAPPAAREEQILDCLLGDEEGAVEA